MLALDRLDLSAGEKAGVDLAEVMRENGGLALLENALASGDPEVQRVAMLWSAEMEAGEDWLRSHVLPAIEDPAGVDPGVLSNSFRALGRPDCGWAQEPILRHLSRLAAESRSSPGDGPPGSLFSAAGALADIGDPAAIPRMIEILLQDESGRLQYGLGHFGLAKRTGVRWQEGYDGEWWLEWWEKNRMRFPPGVRDTAIRR